MIKIKVTTYSTKKQQHRLRRQNQDQDQDHGFYNHVNGMRVARVDHNRLSELTFSFSFFLLLSNKEVVNFW